MTQLNAPYPATAYLTGYLRKIGIDAKQYDPAIELVCRLFSRAGLSRVRGVLRDTFCGTKSVSGSVEFFLEHADRYLGSVDGVVRFLQGRDPSLAVRIASRRFFPEGPRFKRALAELERGDYLDFAFGTIGAQDRAKYFASLFLDDLADVVREGVDSRFALSRYGEKLAASRRSFDPLLAAVEAAPTLVDTILEEITAELLREHEPQVVGLSVPFPGNVYGALRIAKTLKRLAPAAKVVLGGGYANTELRSLTDARIFDFVDFIPLDDGEKPMELILRHIAGEISREKLLRTFVRDDGEKEESVRFISDASAHDVPLRDAGTPTYDGLPLEKYMSVLEMLNPMHRLWSDARWNKVTFAHGCYWKKCSFCDVSLDYIGRYGAAPVDLILDRMEALARETGQTGFHFVDEAAPPALLKALSERILERDLSFSWWGNLRFEKAFTPELARLMARAGCIAVTGGLEVASDRLLKLMNKGVSIEQVARVAKAFNDAGILVHAYLMYGFPTQTEQETVDTLEVVRQLFESGCVDSAYWHRFSATAHAPIGREPGKFGIRILTRKPASGERVFAVNDLEFEDPTGCDHDALGKGLKRALYNYMHGIGLGEDVRAWFSKHAPKTTVSRNCIRRALSLAQSEIDGVELSPHRRV